MNITRFDVSILIGMLLAIILMTFIIPGLGFVNADVTTDDIPEFNMTTDRFDFAGDFPGTPTEADSGYVNASDPYVGNYFKPFADFDLVMVEETANTTWEIRMDDKSGNVLANTTVSPGSEYHLADGQGNEIKGEYTSDAEKITWVYIDSGDYGGIVGQLRYLAHIFVWGFGTFITILTNTFGAIFDVVSFFIGLFHWLLVSYSSIIAAGNGFVATISLIPLILIMYEFSKFIMIVVEILWIG